MIHSSKFQPSAVDLRWNIFKIYDTMTMQVGILSTALHICLSQILFTNLHLCTSKETLYKVVVYIGLYDLWVEKTFSPISP